MSVQSLRKLSDNLSFGKYLGKTVKEVLEIDPSYLVWVHNTVDWFKLESEIYKTALESIVETRFKKHMFKHFNDPGMYPGGFWNESIDDNYDGGHWLS